MQFYLVYFSDFLREIRPTANQLDDLRQGHTTLRDRLRNDAGLSGIYISDFLPGKLSACDRSPSQRRGTLRC